MRKQTSLSGIVDLLIVLADPHLRQVLRLRLTSVFLAPGWGFSGPQRRADFQSSHLLPRVAA